MRFLNSGKLEANGGTVDVTHAVTGSGSAFGQRRRHVRNRLDRRASVCVSSVTARSSSTPGRILPAGVTLAAGAVIDLAGTAVTSAEISGSTVLINGNPETFTVSGLPTGDTFAFKSDGGAGTDLAVLPQVLNVAASPVTGTEGSAIPLDVTGDAFERRDADVIHAQRYSERRDADQQQSRHADRLRRQHHL